MVLSAFLGFGLLAFPEEDRFFAQVARDRIEATRTDGRMVRTARMQLRRAFPNADLHRQRQVNVGGDETEVWFAYRDGRLHTTIESDRWWEAKGAARASVAASGRLTRMNAAWRTLVGTLPESPTLAVLGDYVSIALCRELIAQSAWIAAAGEVTSSADVRLQGRLHVDVEFHVGFDGDGPGHHQVAVRSFVERDRANERRALGASSLGQASPAVQAELLAGAVRRELAPGERLAASIAGDPWVALVVTGVVRLYLSAGVLEPTLVYGHHGSLLGTHWTIADDSIAVGLETVTPAVILQFSARRIQQLVASDTGFARAVANEGRTLLHDVVSSYAARSSANLPQRLAREIMLLSDLQPDDVLLRVTEQQLADGVGSIRESIGRTIADFRRNSWLATTRHGVIVLDPNALRDLSSQN